jgi:hypothetical protein
MDLGNPAVCQSGGFCENGQPEHQPPTLSSHLSSLQHSLNPGSLFTYLLIYRADIRSIGSSEKGQDGYMLSNGEYLLAPKQSFLFFLVFLNETSRVSAT